MSGGGSGRKAPWKYGDLKGIKYEINNPVYKVGVSEFRYYDGIIAYEDHKEEVSFVPVAASHDCKSIVECSRLVSHLPSTLKPFHYLSNEKEDFLLCCERFDILNKMAFCGGLVFTDLGCPSSLVKSMRDILKTFASMLEAQVSSTNLERIDLGFAWHDKSETAKFLMIDKSFEPHYSDEDKEKQLRHLRDQIASYFPVGCATDPKARFLNSFTESTVSIDRRMRYVRNHPYLRADARGVLSYFAELYHAVVAGEDHDGQCTTQFKKMLVKMLQDPTFSGNYLPNGSWKRLNQWVPGFKAAFLGHDEHDILGLMKFIRDLFVHPKTSGMTVDKILEEIVKVWPGLLEAFYLALYQ